MKTLRQIREEYNEQFLGSIGPDELMFESSIESPKSKGGSLMPTKGIPSAKEMPVMLLFRRVSYRIYPNKQVVALYYSSMIDKYLSIPFGPGGNVNLSEAVFHDSLDEGLGDAIEAGRQWAHDKVKDSSTFKAAQELGHKLPGYGNVQAAKKKWAAGDKWGAAKEAGKSLAKAAATGAGVAVAGYGAVRAAPTLARAALSAAAGKGESKGSSDSADSSPSYTGFHRSIGGIKTGTSWSKSSGASDQTARSKLRQADLKQARQVQENKISDIRKMLKEGIESTDITINGRQVTLNTSMAKRILEVYDSVNTKNKKIVEGMLNEDLESFKKLLNFSIRN